MEICSRADRSSQIWQEFYFLLWRDSLTVALMEFFFDQNCSNRTSIILRLRKKTSSMTIEAASKKPRWPRWRRAGYAERAGKRRIFRTPARRLSAKTKRRSLLQATLPALSVGVSFEVFQIETSIRDVLFETFY